MIYMSVVLSSHWLLPSSTTGMASTRRHGAPAAMAARSIGTIGRARPACSVGRDGMGMGWLGHAAARQALLDHSNRIRMRVVLDVCRCCAYACARLCAAHPMRALSVPAVCCPVSGEQEGPGRALCDTLSAMLE